MEVNIVDSTRKNGFGNGWEERGEELENKDMMWSSKWTKVSSCLESSCTVQLALCASGSSGSKWRAQETPQRKNTNIKEIQ